MFEKNIKIECVQKDEGCFLTQAHFEQRHGSKLNWQICFNMYLNFH